MGGKKGRSGPPGNLNRVAHPWDVFWRRRALAPRDKWAALLRERYVSDLISDKPEPSAGELRMMDLCATAHACQLLILAECRRSGFLHVPTDGRWDLQPGAKELARFMGLERQALQALGLERRSKDARLLDLSLTDYLAAQEAQGGPPEAAHNHDHEAAAPARGGDPDAPEQETE